MPFYNSVNDSNNFTISFGKNPRHDFGVFAKGYALAGAKLAEMLLEKESSFRDYEAYPVVFLYRHALELYLKNIIYKVTLLLGFKNFQDIDNKLLNTHDLELLAETAAAILRKSALEDDGLHSIISHISQISVEFSEIDANSFAYRYPIDRKGKPSTSPNQIVNLQAFHQTMSLLMENLEVLDFGINVNTHNAQEVFELVTIFNSSNT